MGKDVKFVVIWILAILWSSSMSLAQVPTPSSAELREENPALAKVSSHLLEARWRESRSPEERQRLTVPGPIQAEPIPFIEAKAEVEIHLTELNPSLLESIRSRGVEVTTSSDRWARVTGRISLSNLDELAALPQVSVIQPSWPPITWAGSVDNQADVTMNTDDARAQYGVDGSGVTVGILSDSWRDLSAGSVTGTGCARAVTGTASQTSGDAPASVGVLDDGPGGPLSDEGRAISELVFDVAPGADQMFHSAFNSEADFADGITELKNCGADVIVDDVFYTTEPMFQDGPVAQAAQDAVDMNVPYFSAAGNSGTFGVDDFFTDSNVTDDTTDPATGNDLHDFDPGAGVDTFAEISVPGLCTVTVVLQWNDPFSGVLGPGASNDLDLYICTAASIGGCAFSSKTRQGCGDPGGAPAGTPFESLGLTNTGGAAASLFVAVEHHCGVQDNHIRLATFTNCDQSTYDFEDGGAGETAIFVDKQIYGHAAAKGAMAVAATFFGEIDSGGAFEAPFGGQLDVEPFSSLGGFIPFYFDGSGAPLAKFTPGPPEKLRDGLVSVSSGTNPAVPEERFKPDITAPDGTNTTFFGSDIAFDADSDPNFFGTSASAPHAAAIAALMIEANNLTPEGILDVFKASALDIEGFGQDALSGFGFVDGFESVGGVQGGSRSIGPSSCNCGLPNQSCPDIIELEGIPNTGTQNIRACTSIKYSNGTFNDLNGLADSQIFADGFESGNTSAWSTDIP